MGLDMYMYRDNYVKNWEHTAPERRHEIIIKKGGEVVTDIDTEKISHITEEVAYWRKFNALHNWIVNRCAHGRDECQEIYVSSEDLADLYDILKKVSSNHSLAEELLPTTSGFFFGSEEYDDYYFDEVNRTIEIFRPYVQEMAKGYNSDFSYQASW